MENNIKISIAIIVKNEEAMLARCLNSVKDADEIILVDTGSVDNTVEIGEKYTKNIHHFEWEDDFSAARNFAKSRCTGDFILSIDADEVLGIDGISKIKEFLKDYTKNAVGISMNSIDTRYHVPRLFKNSENIFWVGKIHETINVTDYEKSNILISYESSPAHALDPERNVRILLKSFGENNNDSRTLYYLGREYAYKNEWINAIGWLKKYLHIATWLPEKADAFFMIALCYWNISEGEKARENCLSAISINANFKAAILLMAHISFKKNGKQWYKMASTASNEDTLFIRENYLKI